VFVYGAETGRPQPRLLATLVRLDQNVLVEQAGVGVEGITVRGYGYSSPNVPRCCPDVHINWRWQWTGSGFARATT